MTAPIEAVIFDWGGTLTPWHGIDFHAEGDALVAALVEPVVDAKPRLMAAVAAVWARSRDHHTSATVADIFAEAGLQFAGDRLHAYRDFWEPHTYTDPEAGPMLAALKASGLKIGILSNTVWPRDWHEEIFARDGISHLIDGAVYSSEIAHTKPSPHAFSAAMAAVGVSQPQACVFVGDRLFDDIWGASTYGMRTVHVPHSDIPAEQLGHSEGQPDAVVASLAHLPGVIGSWVQGSEQF